MNARPVIYPLRSVDTATVRYTAGSHGRRRITIDHRPLPGITPDMLLDWFTHLGGTMVYGDVGRRPLPRLASDRSHPMGIGPPGARTAERPKARRFRMVEAFGGRPEFAIDEVACVEKLDETGIRLVTAHCGYRRLPTRTHLVSGLRRRPLRHCHGPRSPLDAAGARQQDCAPTLSRGEGPRVGQAQHRRGRTARISAADAVSKAEPAQRA